MIQEEKASICVNVMIQIQVKVGWYPWPLGFKVQQVVSHTDMRCFELHSANAFPLSCIVLLHSPPCLPQRIDNSGPTFGPSLLHYHNPQVSLASHH